MALIEQTYVTKPKYIQAIQVTKDNLAAVAVWCGGEVEDDPENGKVYVVVPVRNPRIPRHTQAHPGDWVICTNRGEYRVYLNQAFKNNFDLVNAGQPDPHIVNNYLPEGTA